MSTVKHFAIIAGYGVVTVLAAFIITLRGPSLGAQLGVGVAVFTLVAVVHHFFRKRARDLEFKRHIDALYASRDKLTHEFQVLRDENRKMVVGLSELADFAFADARKFPNAQAELRVLRTLKDEISAVPQSVAPPAAAAPAPVVPAAGEKPKAGGTLDRAQLVHVLRDALKHERIDLFLQPIVKLPQRTPRYYECFSRIRAADGGVVTPSQYLDMAKDHGLLRAIDNMLLFRCIQLVRKAQRRNHDLAFLCNISMQTLGDRQFFKQFVAFMEENRNLAARLVFEVTEDDVETQWETFADDLGKLTKLGFRFSMDNVRHLGFDLELMARRNFTFVKVSAVTLLRYAGNGGRNLRAFKEELQRNKIELIVEKVETEQQLLELLDLDIPLAQGYLFGQPRLSRQD